MNLSTFIVAVLLAVVLGAIVAVAVRNKRKGKCSCGGSCGGCGMQGVCHRELPVEQSAQGIP